MRWCPLILLAACEPQRVQQPPPDAGVQHQASAELRACSAAASGPVDSIARVIDRLNALPAPVTPACLLASLPRPLDVVATISTLSAQPAGGLDSPRIFVVGTGVVISVVPAGGGVRLVELGEWMTSTRTLKGELELPMTAPVAPDAPFTRVAQSNGSSTCSICHRNEAPHPTLPNAFVSDAFRPNPGEEVTVAALAGFHQGCLDGDAGESGDAGVRCALFHALFDFGAVRQGAFSRDVALFIQ